MSKKQWIGVDLDGTLAEVGRDNLGEIGKPITKMMSRVKKWLEDGEYEVRIFTARAGDTTQENKIKKWRKQCKRHNTKNDRKNDKKKVKYNLAFVALKIIKKP